MHIKYTKEILEQAVKENSSFAGILRYFNLKQAGGTQNNIKEKIISFGIDISHFTGQGYNKGKPSPLRKSAEEYIKSTCVSAHKLRLKLFEDGIKEKICEVCGLSEWQGKVIPLELHHIDGNKYNNNFDNLQIICPNCHAQTDTYKSKNRSKR